MCLNHSNKNTGNVRTISGSKYDTMAIAGASSVNINPCYPV
jgi:hypothetical protein